MDGPGRQEVGTTIRAYLPWLQREGVLDHVRAKVSARTRALLDTPPLPTSWIDSALMDEVYLAVAERLGEEGVRRLGYESTRDSYAPLVRRFASTIFSLFGGHPGTLLARAEMLTSSFVRGASFTGLEDERVLLLRNVQPAPRLAYVAWQGVLETLFDLSRTTGEVHLAGLEEEGRLGRFGVWWR